MHTFFLSHLRSLFINFRWKASRRINAKTNDLYSISIQLNVPGIDNVIVITVVGRRRVNILTTVLSQYESTFVPFKSKRMYIIIAERKILRLVFSTAFFFLNKPVPLCTKIANSLLSFEFYRIASRSGINSRNSSQMHPLFPKFRRRASP